MFILIRVFMLHTAIMLYNKIKKVRQARLLFVVGMIHQKMSIQTIQKSELAKISFWDKCGSADDK